MPDRRHYAILIGSSSFHPKSGLKPLRCPEHDVDGMAALLASVEYGLFASENILTFKNQPHHEILPEINIIFSQAQADDLILVYYSGHGELDNKDHLHLATPDTRKAALETTSIPTERLRRLIDNYRCKRVVLILDCCYSGAIKNDLLKSSLDGEMNQLAKGIYILTASTELQTAEEKEGDEHSLLTKHILQGIRQGKVRADANGNISISALQSYVAVVVPQDGSQQPSGYGLDERGGELIIARAAQFYDAARLRTFRLLINQLEADDEIDDELADEARNVIKRNQPKREKPWLDLLNQLQAQTIKPGRFSSQWHRLRNATPAETKQEQAKPAAPLPNAASPEAKARVAKAPVATASPVSTSAKPDTVVAGTGFTDDLKGFKLEMVYVPGGKFTMGSELSDNEKPPHPVTVSNLYIGKFQITQAQWQAVMGKNPSKFKGDDLPVESVSWNDAQQFCQKLSEMTDKAYRLPTEAEWEYACRAGTKTAFAFGDGLSSEQANFDGNYPYGGAAKAVYREKTTPVGSFKPNDFGLYDMHGNVWEWCEDIWHDNYKDAPDNGSAWVKGGNQGARVVRGGSWNFNATECRSAFRDHYLPALDYFIIGFRVVVSARTQ